MNSNFTKPELLAPAGNMVSALTAFDAGADAVYAGLKKFNARERTENFSADDMAKLITYARSNGKKVYVAFNTLIKESEIISAAEMLSELTVLKPDAVIIQDLGVLHMIREYFPSLVVHGSTQMGIHNSEGVKTAAAMGIRRVILERQVTIDEIRKIKTASPIELEIFIHGALCCSLSGKCLFSSFHGGFSGNRGKCKQPCRYNYFNGPDEGYYFSTRDLCSLELIPELKRIGISSLKIEGRLRKQDYVKNVVSAYRLMLDAVPQKEKSALDEAMDLLGLSYGREFFPGFTSEKSLTELIRPESSGVSGSLCGSVAKIAEGGFYVALTRKLHLGDRIRIQSKSGKKGTALTIKEMTVNGRHITEGRNGETCFITTRDREILPDGFVFKIGESIDEMTGRISRLPLTMKRTIDFTVTVSRLGFEIQIRDGNSTLVWKKDIELAQAQKHPLGEEKVKTEFAAASSEILAPGEITAKVNGEFFIPLSVLKDVRREFWKWSEENISKDKSAELAKSKLDDFILFYSSLRSNPADSHETTKAYSDKLQDETGKDYILCRPVYDFDGCDEIILPHFCPENKLSELRNKVKSAYEKGIRRFRLTSLFQIGLLKGFRDLKLSSSSPLPASNSLAICELRKNGFSKVQAWIELEEKEIEMMILKSEVPVEIFRYGRLPLMMTRAEVPAKDEIRDSRGNSLVLKKDRLTGLTCVYSDFAICVPEVKGSSDFFDFTNASPGEKNTSYFNFKSVWE